jgi:hypothetical protein
VRICGIRTVISLQVSPDDRHCLEAVVRDRNTPQISRRSGLKRCQRDIHLDRDSGLD